MTAKVVLNPYSNRWNSQKRWPETEAALKSAGVDFELAASERKGHITELVAQVQHLCTELRARRRAAAPVSLLELAARLHPTPAVGGAPRDAALRWLAAHESVERGWFAGPVGFLQSNGDGEFDVALRSALVRGRSATAWAGAGIVARSEPRAEFTETELKLRTVLGPLLWGAP